MKHQELDGRATPLEVRSDIRACDCLAKRSFNEEKYYPFPEKGWRVRWKGGGGRGGGWRGAGWWVGGWRVGVRAFTVAMLAFWIGAGSMSKIEEKSPASLICLHLTITFFSLA